MVEKPMVQGHTNEVESMNLEDWRSLSNSCSVCYWLDVSCRNFWVSVSVKKKKFGITRSEISRYWDFVGP